MTINYDDITSQIMEGMKQTENTTSVSSKVMKLEIGDSVLGRFVPYKPDLKNSIYAYNHHGWQTNGGEYLLYLCPSTHKEKCPICARSVMMWRSDDPFLKEQSKKIRRRSNYICNFYVIDHPKDPSKNGTVQLFRFGKQIKDIIDEALMGEDAEIFGKNIWRLDSKGCNFRINVKANSEGKDAWPSYTSSKFLPPSDLELSNEEIMEIMDSVYEHTNIIENRHSYEELTMELQENFIDDLQASQQHEEDSVFGMKKTEVKNPPKKSKVVKTEEKEDEEEEDFNFEEAEEEKPKKVEKKEKDISDDIDALLEEL